MSQEWIDQLSYNERFALTYASKPVALISCFATTLVAISILRDPIKRGNMYHRLALGMCISSAFNALNIFLASWAQPRDDGYIHSLGTFNTCTISGFFFQVGFVVQHYYVALSIYVFMALKHEFRIKEIKWIEKYLHIGVFIFPLSSSTFLAAKDLLNPVGFFCWINSYPQGCDEKKYGPCTRGMKDNLIYMFLLGALPTVLNLIVATVIIIACYLNEQLKYRRSSRIEKLRGKLIILEQARRQKSKLIAKQGAWYLVIFYFSYLPLFTAIIVSKFKSSFFPTLLLGSIFLPTDGLFFAIAYIILLGGNDDPVLNRTTNDSPHRYLGNPRPRKRLSFRRCSIFDGTPEQKWKKFGVYIGPESDSSNDLDDENSLNIERNCDSSNDNRESVIINDI